MGRNGAQAHSSPGFPFPGRHADSSCRATTLLPAVIQARMCLKAGSVQEKPGCVLVLMGDFANG